MIEDTQLLDTWCLWAANVWKEGAILDLESRITSLESKLESASPIDMEMTPTNWLPTSSAKHMLQSHRAAITCLAFHPLHPSVASASEDCFIKIWDREVGVLECTLKGHSRPVFGLDFDYTNARTLHGHDQPVSAVRFLTPTGTLLVSTGRDASIRIWDVFTGYCVKRIDTGGEWIRDIAPSFDGVYLVAGGDDRTATIWEASSGQAKTSLPGHESYIECCAFAPALSHSNIAALAPLMVSSLRGSTFIATGSRDKTIKLWND
ncbi:nuclear migration protein NudF [Penicillium longicatenatum]|uniref:nuclear migration protein NudF n=1 Tax=Penicillium longicatenatum TaxID=1561947 RepID=UPI0025491CC1|nr:nuclear migration protein NudF [Penicillium longicatenatum]KAJ5642930.1 nuclear migration protein NudF [Penicillium longicatenatum]